MPETKDRSFLNTTTNNSGGGITTDSSMIMTTDIKYIRSVVNEINEGREVQYNNLLYQGKDNNNVLHTIDSGVASLDNKTSTVIAICGTVFDKTNDLITTTNQLKENITETKSKCIDIMNRLDTSANIMNEITESTNMVIRDGRRVRTLIRTTSAGVLLSIVGFMVMTGILLTQKMTPGLIGLCSMFGVFGFTGVSVLIRALIPSKRKRLIDSMSRLSFSKHNAPVINEQPPSSGASTPNNIINNTKI